LGSPTHSIDALILFEQILVENCQVRKFFVDFC
jgi:hypothetical protein